MILEPAHVMIALGLLALVAPALRLSGVHGPVIEPGGSFRARLGAVTYLTGADPAPILSAAQPTAGPPVPVSHIERLEAIVASAIETARKAESLHASAHAQVDAAHYALQGLHDELTAIIPQMAASAAPRSGPARPARALQRRYHGVALAA